MRVDLAEKASLRAGRIHGWIRLLSLCVTLGVSLVTQESRALSISASVDRSTVLIGEPVSLTLSIEGATLQSSPRLPAIPGMQFLPGTSTGLNSATGPNGETTTVQTFSFNLAPTQIGEIAIPSFELAIQGQKLSTQPLKLTVLREDPNAPPPELAGKPAFLWAVWPKRECYLNEVLTVELRLYLGSGVRRIGNLQIPQPTGDGLVLSSLRQGQQYQRRVGNVMFTVVPYSLSLSPTRTGPLKVDPIRGSVVLNPRDIFDSPFFDSAFSRGPRPQQVPLELGAQTMTVQPLPAEDVPESFAGAVGQFQMNVSAGPTNVTVGDPITLRVQISGAGNMSSISLPLPLVRGDFKTYEPESKLDTTDDSGFAGLKTVEQIIIPENTEVREVPPIEFSFFDPVSEQYRTLRHPATPLQVMPAGSRPALVVPLADDLQQSDGVRQDIVHIKQRLDAPQAGRLNQSLGAPFYALNAVPLFAWLVAVAWRKRVEALGRNPRLRRKQEVGRVIAQGLDELRHLSQKGQSEDFFATVFRLLQEQIGLLLDQPASGITESVVDDKLAARGIAASTLDALHELFQVCNVARYAPTGQSHELAALLPKLEQVLRELEEAQA